jgi:hypothetical protein
MKHTAHPRIASCHRIRGGVRGIALLFGLMAACAGMSPHRAAAQATTQRPASIIIFPKVIADGTRDTILQLTNTTNNFRSALCLYLDGSLTFPSLPPSPSNPPQCAQTNFDLSLGPQQPTYWVASTGRAVDAADPAGIDPGLIPPVMSGFEGALFCVELDSSGAPISGNSLIGTATVQNTASGDVAQYNAIGLRGFDTNDGDGTLCLGGSVTASCPFGAEYDGCPEEWSLDHLADDAQDSIVGAGSSVRTELTAVPCAQDFNLANPTSVSVSIQIRNEFEQPFSASTTVDCWINTELGQIGPTGTNPFTFGTLGTTYALTSFLLVPGQSGVAMVAQELHVDAENALSTSAATNVHVGSTPPAALRSDQMTLPPRF